MRVAALALLLVALAPARPARAGDTTTAADATESGRRLDRALDIVLDATSRVAGGPRTLVLLLDATPSLKASGFADRLETALARQGGHLQTTEIAVARVGEKDPVVLAPTADRAAVARAAHQVVTAARNTIQNVYADLRAVAGLLAGRSGSREVALVTLENGDAEDDLEATVSALRKAKVRAFVVAREAILSDSYWLSHGGRTAPAGTAFTGGDAAFSEIPWGWLFQVSSGHEAASSGYATYGLTRVARATDGRVFLASEGGSTGHSCETFGGCSLCTGDHVPSGETYDAGRVRVLAPLAQSREEVVAAAARDPWYRAVCAAWRDASDAGLLRSRPTLEVSGGGARLDKRPLGAWVPLTGNGLAFQALAVRAGKALEACDRVRAALDVDLGKIPEAEGSPRWRAVADYTRLMLLLTRLNLVEYVGWCQDAAPALSGRKPREVQPPEVPMFAEGTRLVGVSYANYSLCHGVRPFREIHLPGGAALRGALDDLDAGYAAYMARYAGTPFAVAAHRSSVAHFLFTVAGKPPPPPDRKRGGSPGEEATTPGSDRPTREGGGTTGTGPTTGG